MKTKTWTGSESDPRKANAEGARLIVRSDVSGGEARARIVDGGDMWVGSQYVLATDAWPKGWSWRVTRKATAA